MATTYSGLQVEIQRWLDNDNPNLINAIPTFIADAEASFSRMLRCSEQECLTLAPLIPSTGSTSETIGIYQLPTDCAALGNLYVQDPNLHIMYWKNIPALSGANTTNWLLTKHPDLYRYTALISAEPFLKDDARVITWAEQARAVLNEVVSSDSERRHAGSRIRVRTPEDLQTSRSSKSTGHRLTQLPLWEFTELVLSGTPASQAWAGYYTIAGDKIHIWPKPACTDAST